MAEMHELPQAQSDAELTPDTDAETCPECQALRDKHIAPGCPEHVGYPNWSYWY